MLEMAGALEPGWSGSSSTNPAYRITAIGRGPGLHVGEAEVLSRKLRGDRPGWAGAGRTADPAEAAAISEAIQPPPLLRRRRGRVAVGVTLSSRPRPSPWSCC